MFLRTTTYAMTLICGLGLAACADDSGGAGDTAGDTGSTGSEPDTGSVPSTTSGGPDDGADTTAADADTTVGANDTGMGTTDDDGGSTDDDGSTGSDSTGEVPSVTLNGVVTDFGSPNPVPNLDVCVFEQESIPCAVTDAKGAYTLMGVPSAEGAIEFTGVGRFPSLFWGSGPTEDDELNYNSLSALAAAVLAAALGEEIDDASGHLALAVSDGKGTLVSGVTFTLDPPSGVIGYLDQQGINTDLVETSEVGFAGLINVDVGEVEVTATHETLTCIPGPGALVGGTPDTLRIDIRAGYLGSTFPFVCQ